MDRIIARGRDWTIGAAARTLAGMDDIPVTPSDTVDLRGLKCPLPVLRTRRILAGLAPGRILAVLCTDPLAGLDIPNLVRETGDRLLASLRDGTEMRFLIEKR